MSTGALYVMRSNYLPVREKWGCTMFQNMLYGCEPMAGVLAETAVKCCKTVLAQGIVSDNNRGYSSKAGEVGFC